MKEGIVEVKQIGERMIFFLFIQTYKFLWICESSSWLIGGKTERTQSNESNKHAYVCTLQILKSEIGY